MQQEHHIDALELHSGLLYKGDALVTTDVTQLKNSFLKSRRAQTTLDMLASMDTAQCAMLLMVAEHRY